MFARKYLVTCAEEVLGGFKFHFCDQIISGSAKCPSSGPRVFEVGRRWSHWSAGSLDSLKTHRELTGFRIARPTGAMSEINCTDRLEDNLESTEMEISGSGSDDDTTCEPQCLYSDSRPIEFTTYGLELSHKLEDLNSEMVSVATFNVLSQVLLERHRYLYKNCKPRDLRWDNRSAMLLRDFHFLSSDVLCLQEVEGDHVDAFFKKELAGLGYLGIFKKRTHDKTDGCAIFYKNDKFDLVDRRTVELFKPKVKLLDRDNIGVIVRLALKARPNQHIVVATTHLLYTPRRTDIRLTQTQIMLAEIERMAFKGDDSYWPIIFTGDMNYTPHSVVYDLVKEGYIRYEKKDIYSPKYLGDKKDLLPKFVGVTDSCQYASALENRFKTKSSLLYGSGTLDHRLNFASAYSHVKDGIVEASTHQDEWHTVDYIFYSQSSQKSEKRENELMLVNRLGLPNAEEAAADLGRLPNGSCGSDHLPLLATFHLPLKPINPTTNT